LSAYCDPATRVTAFDQPVTVTMGYNVVNRDSVSIYRYNTLTPAWEELNNCVVGTNTVTCETTDFSTFGVFGTVPTGNIGAGGGSAPQRHIVNVCSYETGKCEDVFPSGKDQAYKDYLTCYQKEKRPGIECATAWAESKNYVAVADFNPDLVVKTQATTNEFLSVSETAPIRAKEEACETVNYVRYPEQRGQGINQALFRDTQDTHPAYEALIDLAEQKIVNGDDKTGYARLDSPISRAEVVKVMTIARQDRLKQGTCAANTEFPDVEKAGWYHDFVQNMEQQGIVHGYDDGLYRPGKTIVKAELYKIIAISFGYITNDEAKVIAQSRDLEWYVPYVEALETAVSLPKALANAAMDKPMTRGETFQLLSVVLKDIDTAQ